jgi:hypothetical protein
MIIGKLILLRIARIGATREFKVFIHVMDSIIQTIFGMYPLVTIFYRLDCMNEIIVLVEDTSSDRKKPPSV